MREALAAGKIHTCVSNTTLMKKLVTRGFYVLPAVIFFLCAALSAKAQYSGTNLETGGLYTALAKDASNNLYVTRVTSGTGGALYEVDKYTGGTGTPVSIYSGLTHETGDYPWGLAVTSSGNVFISTDFTTGGGSIIKLTYSGGVYTSSIIQTGRYFSALAVDTHDNLYTAEYDAANSSYAVVEYTASSSYATGTKLYDNLKTGVGYTYPTGLAVASNGNVYVADAFSNDPSITDGGHVYKLTAASAYAVSTLSSGNYVTALNFSTSGNLFSSENRGTGYSLVEYLGGTGSGVPVSTPLHTNGIYYPWGIAFISVGKIFVADGDDGVNGGAVIKMVPSPPIVTTATVTSTTSTGTTLNGVVNDNGNTTTVNFIYGTSSTLTGATTTQATTGGTISAGSGNTNAALNISGLTASTKYYYAVSATNSGGTRQGAILNFFTTPTISYSSPMVYNSGTNIPVLSPVSSVVPLPAYGNPITIGSGFLTPFGVAADVAGNVYVADYGNHSLKEIPVGGGAPITLATGYTTLLGVAVDAANNVYTCDAGTATIQKIPNGGTGTPVTIGSGFSAPYGLTVDAAGNVYVADYSNSAVYKIAAAGGATTSIGSGFASPTGVAVDAAGNVYVADYGNHVVKEIPVGGGAPVTIGSGFSAPVGIGVDPSGNIFVADYGNSTLQEIPTGGGTQVALGSGYVNPAGVAIDGFGKLFVAGYLSNLVNQLTPVGGYYISTALPLGLGLSNKTGKISGLANAISPAKNYTVTAYNAGGGTSAAVNIKVVANARLSSLIISQGTLTPAFAIATTSYTATVAHDVSSITLTPTTNDAMATVTVNGVSVSSGTASASILLNFGANVITTVITARDGVTTKTYTVTVTRVASSNADLANLTISAGALNPVFATATASYTASVANSVTSVTVTPTTADATATVTVNGIPVNSGLASGAIPLSTGPNTITTIVTAQDGITTKTYSITVTRALSSNANLIGLSISAGTLTPAFTATTTSYTASVANAVTLLTVTPKSADVLATITVNGTAVSSGTASGSIPLNVGPNVITTIVTAQNGIATKTYTITVTRAASTNADLSNLSVSSGTISPAFASGTTGYTASVINTVTSLTVTPTTSDATATITVNGTAVTSGSASGAISLNTGPNTITTVVTAQDGVTTKTYTVTVTRALSSNANLIGLTLSSGPLTPAFTATTTSYTASVANAVTSLTVTPKSADALATIIVNGIAVSSGTASGAIPLNLGNTVITTLVTAQNGTTTKTYTITVTRAAVIANLAGAISVSNPTDHPQMMGEELVVRQALSPNGDGINDFLLIDGITNYPDNKLTIMNRSGQLIFEAKGYDNSAKVFDGHSNKTGAMQLPGTYFYSLDFTVNGTIKHKTGFIILKY